MVCARAVLVEVMWFFAWFTDFYSGPDFSETVHIQCICQQSFFFLFFFFSNENHFSKKKFRLRLARI